jgi:hypothetical protein
MFVEIEERRTVINCKTVDIVGQIEGKDITPKQLMRMIEDDEVEIVQDRWIMEPGYPPTKILAEIHWDEDVDEEVEREFSVPDTAGQAKLSAEYYDEDEDEDEDLRPRPILERQLVKAMENAGYTDVKVAL